MADNLFQNDINGLGRSQLKYMLLHASTLANLTDYTHKKGLFYFNSTNDIIDVLFDDVTSWRTLIQTKSLNDPTYLASESLEGRLAIGTTSIGNIIGYNPALAGFLKTDIDGYPSTQAKILFEDVEPTDYTTVITAPGLDTRFATEKAIVDYVGTLTFTPQDNILDWNGTRYLPYSAKIVSNPGYAYFYTGTSLPSFSANNLNLDGNLRANNVFAMLSGTTRYSILAYNGFGNYSTPVGKNAEVSVFANSTGTEVILRSRDITSAIGIPIRIGHDPDITGVGYHNESIIIDDYNRLFNIDMTTVRLNKGTALKYLYLDASKNITYVDAPAGGVTPVDNILDWDTNAYKPFTAKTASALYTGITVADAVATILNYDGIFRATQLFEGNTRVMTTHGNWAASGSLHAITTTTNAGFCPQLPTVDITTKFLRGDGTWISPNLLWTDATMSKAGDIAERLKICIIPDMRFINEYKAVLRSSLYGQDILIKRDLPNRDNHSSETIDFECSVVVDNNGTKLKLFYKALNIVQKMFDND